MLIYILMKDADIYCVSKSLDTIHLQLSDLYENDSDRFDDEEEVPSLEELKKHFEDNYDWSNSSGEVNIYQTPVID